MAGGVAWLLVKSLKHASVLYKAQQWKTTNVLKLDLPLYTRDNLVTFSSFNKVLIIFANIWSSNLPNISRKRDTEDSGKSNTLIEGAQINMSFQHILTMISKSHFVDKSKKLVWTPVNQMCWCFPGLRLRYEMWLWHPKPTSRCSQCWNKKGLKKWIRWTRGESELSDDLTEATCTVCQMVRPSLQESP